MLSLDESREFDARRDADFFALLPAEPGVFLLEMADQKAAPYLAQTASIRRAAERLLREPEGISKRLNLRSLASRIRYRVTPSKFERSFVLYKQTRALFPQQYRDRLKLRPPALLKVNLRNSYPRCYVTRRIRVDEAFYFGPFPSRRAADAFNEGWLDQFKIRRCQIKIRRDPSFPGCVYSEMKMCMAPCFAGCTKEQYDADVSALVAGLDTRGSAVIDPIEKEREAASEGLDFERAAMLHKRVEKIRVALRGLPEIVHRIDGLDALILQRAAAEKSVIAFPLIRGILAEPVTLIFTESNEPRSVEAALRAVLEPESLTVSPEAASKVQSIAAAQPLAPENTASRSLREEYGLLSDATHLTENLSLVSRWFYSKPREGEILFRDRDWPYRRILRACSRILNPPAPQATETPSPASS